jgi:hypothetical protein
MKALILFISLAALVIGSAGCAVFAGRPHRYYHPEPDVVIIAPVPPHYPHYGPPPHGPPPHREFRNEPRHR